ncbi:hypothetical protein NDU88_002701 [Pleurodeles waltl]|uniref:Uncharacterized protein n=1 Tax=Pleurodeles waltl TaxID=8319 RepID=A0AAV7UZB8_PLEWA|nr:hypothetical protein NDU88_002701 [Pleurodeles waltl]
MLPHTALAYCGVPAPFTTRGVPAVFPRDRARQRPRLPPPCGGCLKEGISAAHHSRRGDPPHLCQAADFAAPPGPLSSAVLSLPTMAFLWGIRPWPNTPVAAILLTSSSGSCFSGNGPDSARDLSLLSVTLAAHRSQCGTPPHPFRAQPGPMSGCAPLTGALMEGPRPRAPRHPSPLQAVVRAGRSIPLQRSLSPVSTLLHGRAASLVVCKRCRYFYCSFIGASLFLVYSEGQLFQIL